MRDHCQAAWHRFGVLAVGLMTTLLLTVGLNAPVTASGVGITQTMNFGFEYYYGLNKCVDTANGSNNTFATTWTCYAGDEHQNWSGLAVDWGNGTKGFYNPYFNKCLRVQFLPYNGIYEYPCTGDSFEQWAVTHVGGSTYVLRNIGQNKCLDVGNTTNGSHIGVYPCNGGYYQEWLILYIT